MKKETKLLGNPTSVRFPPPMLEQIKETCTRKAMDRGEFIRRAVADLVEKWTDKELDRE